MSYKVLEDFADILDNGYMYRAGDTYPRAGHMPGEARIKELGSTANKLGRKLIEVPEPSKAETEPEPEPKPKKRTKK